MACVPNPETPFAGGARSPVNIGSDIELDMLNDVDIESVAGFSHAAFDLSDRLNILGDLRYTWESRKNLLSHRRIKANIFITGSPRTAPDRWNGLSFGAGINFKVTEDVMLYGPHFRGLNPVGLTTASG